MIISYRKRWGTDGTCYKQTIKIDKKMMDQFNNFLQELKKAVEEKFQTNHVYSDNDLKYKSLELLHDGVNYTNLIHLQLFNALLVGLNIDNKRIINNNTIIEVI